MTAEPRVAAVAEALDFLWGTDDLIPSWDEHAKVAVAALDAYDLDNETPEGGRKAAAVARAVMAERRRIAQEIDEWAAGAGHERTCRCDFCGLHSNAVRIARGAES